MGAQSLLEAQRRALPAFMGLHHISTQGASLKQCKCSNDLFGCVVYGLKQSRRISPLSELWMRDGCVPGRRASGLASGLPVLGVQENGQTPEAGFARLWRPGGLHHNYVETAKRQRRALPAFMGLHYITVRTQAASLKQCKCSNDLFGCVVYGDGLKQWRRNSPPSELWMGDGCVPVRRASALPVLGAQENGQTPEAGFARLCRPGRPTPQLRRNGRTSGLWLFFSRYSNRAGARLGRLEARVTGWQGGLCPPL